MCEDHRAAQTPVTNEQIAAKPDEMDRIFRIEGSQESTEIVKIRWEVCAIGSAPGAPTDVA
jgi:hypothetical protein